MSDPLRDALALADSEGTRAVEYLRRAWKAEEALRAYLASGTDPGKDTARMTAIHSPPLIPYLDLVDWWDNLPVSQQLRLRDTHAKNFSRGEIRENHSRLRIIYTKDHE